MSTELELRPVVSEATLEDLVETVRAQHELVLDSATAALHHARAAGQALEDARAFVDNGDWLEWLLATFDFKLSAAYNYMRIARNWEMICERGYVGVSDAVKGIARRSDDADWGPRGRNGQRGRPGVVKYGEDTYQQIRELHASGMSMNRISVVLEISSSTVLRAVFPEKAREQDRRSSARQQARRKAWQRERRAHLARKAGGDIAVAYSKVRELAEVIDRAAAAEGDAEAKSALNAALLRLYNIEDLVVKALGTHKDAA